MTTPTHYRQCGAIGRPILLALGVPAELLDGTFEELIAALHDTLNFHEINALKYLWRAGQKEGILRDLAKALDCLTRLSPQLGGSVPPDETLDMIRWLLQVSPR
jgi:hypothetical protein